MRPLSFVLDAYDHHRHEEKNDVFLYIDNLIVDACMILEGQLNFY